MLPQQLLPVSAAGSGRRRCCSNPLGSHPQQLLTVFRAERSLLVDIPTGWEPRTEQQPTGLIAHPAAQGRAVRILPVAQKRKAQTQCAWAFLGAMEGTRTPGLLIRRNRIAHFVHFIIQRQIVVLIESQLFFRCYSVASFALLARLCTCYPSLRCAENVQKCAEPKSARQNRLFRTAPKAGFQRYLLCKIFQFYPNNNLT